MATCRRDYLGWMVRAALVAMVVVVRPSACEVHDAVLDRFYRWCEARDIKSLLKVDDVVEQGVRMRGVVATRDIQAGENVFEVPFGSMFCAFAARNSLIGHVFHGDLWNDEMIMIIWFMYEVIQEESPWLPYIDSMIGGDLDHPSTWSDEKTYRHNNIMRVQIWASKYMGSADYLLIMPWLQARHPEIFGGEYADWYTWENFLWARNVITTRHWGYLKVNESLYFPSTVPFADMTNFGRGPAEYDFSMRDGMFTMKTTAPLKKGQHFVWAYQENTCHEQTLANYGFIDAGGTQPCPHNFWIQDDFEELPRFTEDPMPTPAIPPPEAPRHLAMGQS